MSIARPLVDSAASPFVREADQDEDEVREGGGMFAEIDRWIEEYLNPR
jgi:hypothetical protein